MTAAKPKTNPETDAALQAVESLKGIKGHAKDELASFESVQTFEMESEANDRNGEPTKALVVDIKAKGVMALFVKTGNPFSLTEDGVSEDSDKLLQYLNLMVNIDLESDEALEAAGIEAIDSAREMVRGYFIMRAMSGLKLDDTAIKQK